MWLLILGVFCQKTAAKTPDILHGRSCFHAHPPTIKEIFMIFLFLLILIAAIAVYKLLPLSGGGHQAFTDIVIENVSASGFNKSGELQLFWLILLAGAFLLLLSLFLHNRITEKKETAEDAVKIELSRYRFPVFGGIMIFPFLFYLIIFQKFSFPLFAGLVIFILCHFFCRKETVRILLIFALSYYALTAIFTILVQLWNGIHISSKILYFLSILTGTILSAAALWFEAKKPSMDFGNRLILVLQCFLPGLLTIWLVDDYLYQGNLIQVPYASGYTVFFFVFILISAALLIIQAVRLWNKNSHYFIGAVTPVLIFVYHSFCAAPMYAQPDQHHHGEQMILWNQFFDFGQSLYKEYTPVSGLFPFVNGFFQNLWLGNTVTDYSPAISITMVIFCIITMYLIYRHVGGAYATAFAVFFTLPCYNRQYMVLPVLLLLTLPELLKKKNLWLWLWIFSCFLSGLYYPLFGAALLIGTFPLGVYQLFTFIKSGGLKSYLKKPLFYVAWGVLLLIVSGAAPLLLRMVRHTLIYSSQTVMADGIPLLGQNPPDVFMPYLTSFSSLRQGIYLCFRFLFPAAGVWVFLYCFYYFIKKHSLSGYALFFMAGALTLMVSYSYTLVRADIDKILSRTAGVFIAVTGIFLPVLLIRYGKTLPKRSTRSVFMGLCFSLPMMIYAQVSWTKNPDLWIYPDGESQLVMDDAAKLYSFYEVPEIFLKSEDTGLPEKYQKLLGSGFMVSDQLHYITDYASVTEKCDALSDTIAYMALDGQGFYDYLGIRCSVTGFIPAARSYEAQKVIWDTASENLPVVFYIQPERNYYIFRFMLDAGYVYCAKDGAFYPSYLYNSLYDTNAQNIYDGDDYRIYVPATDFGSSSESFGASMDSLSEIIVADAAKSLNAHNLPDSFDGITYDLLYLELSDTAEIPEGSLLTLTWSDTEGNSFEGSLASCTIKEGQLLIPMGMNPCWLLSSIEDFTITVTAPDGNAALYETTYKKLNASEEDSAFIENLSLMQLNVDRDRSMQ